MASPFPGMDPYLEQFWRDVHASLIIYARDAMQGYLPPDLRARVEERVFVESPLGVERSVYPDVRVVERGRGSGAIAVAESNVAVAEPIAIHLEDEPITESFIEIIDVGSGKRVVSVIEFLSLSNKLPGPGQELYLQKQRELHEGRVSHVEIDLLRAGKRVLTVADYRIPHAYRTQYQACTCRGWESQTAYVYRVSLRERLPVIKVPLRETDREVPLDLQSLIDQCYRNGGYDEDIDYKVRPEPPLDSDDARWADELIRAQSPR